MTLGLPSELAGPRSARLRMVSKSKIYFSANIGISSSEMASPLVWRDTGNSRASHAAGLRFQEVFVESEKWLRRSDEMFRRAGLHEAEITESLIAATRRAAAHAPRERLGGCQAQN
ncbi:hypothetical protein [Bradyrhizobium lablabi]|uniref:hypothetical protein n=1 Tax=Bradyrhizobium lablabi TaxID=722472 RepID=UPI0012E36495|nr:hypothetical protein [Bradyrhizobium lablabi]